MDVSELKHCSMDRVPKIPSKYYRGKWYMAGIQSSILNTMGLENKMAVTIVHTQHFTQTSPLPKINKAHDCRKIFLFTMEIGKIFFYYLMKWPENPKYFSQYLCFQCIQMLCAVMQNLKSMKYYNPKALWSLVQDEISPFIWYTDLGMVFPIDDNCIESM